MHDARIDWDEFGSAYIVEVSDPAMGIRGYLVIDNLALGPGKGGIRMTPDVTLEEVFRLARTMTWKNALAGIPFGGAKAGMVWNGGGDEVKKQHVQAFARLLKPFIPKQYIAGPDVNSGEKEMQWFSEALHNWRAATGKPSTYCISMKGSGRKKCGLPHELGSTGFGVAHAAAVAARLNKIDIQNATVAIEGFGNVGTFAFRHLAQMGARIVAVADSKGAIYNPQGLNYEALSSLKAGGGSVSELAGGRALLRDDFFALDVDMLIPAAVTDAINESNRDGIKARIIVEGANIPMSEAIEDELFHKGIVIVPDVVANAGGVISSYAEYRGYSPEQMFSLVERKVTRATTQVMKKSMSQKRNPRAVAIDIARQRVRNAMHI